VSFRFVGLDRELSSVVEQANQLDALSLDRPLLEAASLSIQLGRPAIRRDGFRIGVDRPIFQIGRADQKNVGNVGLAPGCEFDLAFPIATGERRGGRCEQEGGDEG
jgi:hypothetical protein